MPYDTTSWFIDKASQQDVEPVRCFIIDDVHYEDYVQRWPKFNRSWDDIRPINFTINLSNADKTFNFFLEDKRNFGLDVCLAMGFQGDNILAAADDFTNSEWQDFGYEEKIATTRTIVTDASTIFAEIRQYFGEGTHLGIPDGIEGTTYDLTNSAYLGTGLDFSEPTSAYATAPSNGIPNGTPVSVFLRMVPKYNSGGPVTNRPMFSRTTHINSPAQCYISKLSGSTWWTFITSAGNNRVLTYDTGSGDIGEWFAGDIKTFGLVADSNYLAAYLDGVMVSSEASFASYVPNSGAYQNVLGYYMAAPSTRIWRSDCTVLDLKIYPETLNNSSMLDLHNYVDIAANPSVDLSFDNTLEDDSAYGNDATLGGMSEVYNTFWADSAGLSFTNPTSGYALFQGSGGSTGELTAVVNFTPRWSSSDSFSHPILGMVTDPASPAQLSMLKNSDNTMLYYITTSANQFRFYTYDNVNSGDVDEFFPGDNISMAFVVNSVYWASYFNGALVNSHGTGGPFGPKQIHQNILGYVQYALTPWPELMNDDFTVNHCKLYADTLDDNEISTLHSGGKIAPFPYVDLEFDRSLSDASSYSNDATLSEMAEIYLPEPADPQLLYNPYTLTGLVKRNTDNTSHFHLIRLQHNLTVGSAHYADFRFRSDVFTYDFLDWRGYVTNPDSGTWMRDAVWIGSDEYYEFSFTPVSSPDFTHNNSWQLSIFPGVGYDPWTYVSTTNGSLELANLEYRRGTEIIKLFEGTTDKVVYKDNLTVDITIHDKFKNLSERTVGKSDVPASFVGSDYLPSELALWLVTSYGGYSAIESTSNPDIDWAAFLAWTNVFSSNNVYVEAEFDGQKVTECLRKIGRMTSSGIFIERNKITFKRFASLEETVVDVSEDTAKFCEVEIDDNLIVNEQFVYANYSPSSDYFQVVVSFIDSDSQIDNGIREEVEQDENVWYVNTASALDLAQRLVSTNADAYDQVKIDSTLYLLPYLIGEGVSAVSSFYSIDGAFRILDKSIDMEKCLIRLDMDRSLVAAGFILDVSTWDNPTDGLV